MNNDSRKNGEKLVVTENNRRVSNQTHDTQETAQAEANARKKQLREAGGNVAGSVAVKQQIYG